jgi:dolichyl-phosphate beta-glucosyltransferase
MKLLRMPMKSPAYSLVIPAYNESLRIAATLQRVLGFFLQERWDAEVLVVNDGSGDNTAEIVRGYAAGDQRVRLIENPGNRGKGYSVRHGMMQAAGELMLFSDADLSSPIEEAAKLVKAIRDGAEVAIGSRWMNPKLMTERQSTTRQLLGRIYNVLPRTVLGLNFKDTQCGLKAFTRRAAMEIFSRQRIEGWGFDAELLFLARRLGFKTVEVPVAWAHDERSKINPLKDGIRMAGEIALIRWNGATGKYSQPVPLGEEKAAKAPVEQQQRRKQL